MPEEQTQINKSAKSCSEILVHKKIPSGSTSSTSENLFYVPEVEFASVSGNDSGVDSPRNCENQPLLGRMQCDMMCNTFPGKCYLVLRIVHVFPVVIDRIVS